MNSDTRVASLRLNCHSGIVLSRYRIYDTLISVGWYVLVLVVLAGAYVLIVEFLRAVDSIGLNVNRSVLYLYVDGLLAGAFGPTFAENLLARGPYQLAMVVASLPVLIYLSLGAVMQFGFEREQGVVTLITYGPASAVFVWMSLLIRNVCLTILFCTVLAAFFATTARLGNLVLPASFLPELALVLGLAWALTSLGMFASAVAKSAQGSTVVFGGLICGFAVVQLGSYLTVEGFARTAAESVFSTVRWLSPFAYWQSALSAVAAEDAVLMVLNSLALVLVGVCYCVAGGLIMMRWEPTR